MQLARSRLEEYYEEFKRGGGDEAEELDYRHVAREAIKGVLEEVMAWEVSVYVGAGRYERGEGRVDHLNGSYVRRLLTEVGDIEVRVPRTRKGGFVWDLGKSRPYSCTPDAQGWVPKRGAGCVQAAREGCGSADSGLFCEGYEHSEGGVDGERTFGGESECVHGEQGGEGA